VGIKRREFGQKNKHIPHRPTSSGMYSVGRTVSTMGPCTNLPTTLPTCGMSNQAGRRVVSGQCGGCGECSRVRHASVYGYAMSKQSRCRAASGQKGGCGECVRGRYEHTVQTPLQAREEDAASVYG